MELFEFVTLILMPVAIGTLAAATRKASSALFWSAILAMMLAECVLLLVFAVASSPNPEFLPTVTVGAVFYALPTFGAFAVARQRFFTSRPVAAGVTAGVSYILVALMAVSGAAGTGILKP